MTNASELAELGRTPTIKGFAAFYALVQQKTLPPYATKDWLPHMVKAWKSKTPYLLEAFRGSTKTTTLATFAAWMLGHDPAGSGLIIRSNEIKAAEMAEMAADIIENSPGWKAVFPYVIPDKDKGWSAQGYEIKLHDSVMSYPEWRQMNADRLDPSFAGLSWNARALMGWHPRTFLILDDLLDEENTGSARMIEEVQRRVMGTIMHTRAPHNPFFSVSGVPFTSDDIIAAFKATGEFICDWTPIYKTDGTSQWPEVWTKERIEQERRLDVTGGVQFARNMLLDLTAAQSRVFKYQTYPNHLINPTWVGVGGNDFASVMDPLRRTSYHSHFALAYVLKLPEGGAVVMDGVLEQCSQAEAEGYIERAQSMFPNWQGTVIEQFGVGDQFFQMLYRKPHIKIIPMPRHGRAKAKADRLANELGPWLENGRLRISDAETKFLSALRRFLNNYPNVREHDPGWDAADAVYWAAMGMPDTLVLPTPKGRLESPRPWRKEPEPNPFSTLGGQH